MSSSNEEIDWRSRNVRREMKSFLVWLGKGPTPARWWHAVVSFVLTVAIFYGVVFVFDRDALGAERPDGVSPAATAAYPIEETYQIRRDKFNAGKYGRRDRDHQFSNKIFAMIKEAKGGDSGANQLVERLDCIAIPSNLWSQSHCETRNAQMSDTTKVILFCGGTAVSGYFPGGWWAAGRAGGLCYASWKTFGTGS